MRIWIFDSLILRTAPATKQPPRKGRPPGGKGAGKISTAQGSVNGLLAGLATRSAPSGRPGVGRLDRAVSSSREPVREAPLSRSAPGEPASAELVLGNAREAGGREAEAGTALGEGAQGRGVAEDVEERHPALDPAGVP